MSLSSCNAQGQVHALRNVSNLYTHSGFSLDACTCVYKYGQMRHFVLFADNISIQVANYAKNYMGIKQCFHPMCSKE